MKKLKFIIPICVLIIAAVGVWAYFTYLYMPSNWMVEGDDAVSEVPFEEELNGLDMMDNTWEQAVPQTEIYNVLKAHFESPLPEGKTVKKAIVIGYDGCRVDLLRLLSNSKRSAVNHLLDGGGQALFSYCGGVNYPEKNVQDTSTAPGWGSMLTGQWAYTFGLTENDISKPVEPKTLLIESVESGLCNKSAFYVSWKGHFSRNNATYLNELDYIEKNKLNCVFLRAKNDDGTRDNIINDLKQDNCSDFIFSTFEYTDHSGHRSGFSLQNKKYVNGFRNAEATGMDIIEAVESRKNYANEDWLILITTDHGGIEKDHGGPSFEERITFIVSNKDVL